MSSKYDNTRSDYIFRKVIPKDGRVHTEKVQPPDIESLAASNRVTIVRKRHRFRSDFELTLARKLAEKGRDFEYETQKIAFQPKIRNYTPDFWFPEYGFFVEAKGKFDTADRSKHLLIKKQNPDVDIRFVFQRARNKIRKNSLTSYATWCDRHKFIWAEGSIPEEWFKNDRRI